MKHYYYAVIDENNICCGDATVPSKIDNNRYVEITSLPAHIGKKYENGEWVEVEKEEVEPEPTQLDLIQQAVEKSNEELRQEGAEAVTLELIERGVL